jgi:hypothetical protein
MSPRRQDILRELRRGLICALLIAMLWSAIYWVMGISITSAVLAAAVVAVVRLAVSKSYASKPIPVLNEAFGQSKSLPPARTELVARKLNFLLRL